MRKKLANIETDEILDDVKNGTTARIKDIYGTIWDITNWENDSEASMTYISGTNVYITFGSTYSGLNLNTNREFSFVLAWGSGSYVYFNNKGPKSITVNTDCSHEYIFRI
ncbi:MAG: hypothetical protein L6U99_01140 [Clostridium sp.]|nr:MAG: hypothetical protein L6U99_01140 [Clostridium sp.]